MPARSTAPRPTPTRADWARVRLFAMDVDGVLTDGNVFIAHGRSELKSFSILDGSGLKRAIRQGVAIAWISGRPSPATTARAKELGIPHVVQGRSDKLTALQELARELNLHADDCVYMGDDDIDAPAMRWARIGVSVPGAMAVAHAAADYITQRDGGRGAVREVCDLILAARAAKKATG
ncbi:HAD hydrolase family protein [Horticoccus luteus]|uniref:HAD hydrolase family protein n=1 Tax=Horticoccus luteus TaxID=2862869 RepID=A0A8F9TRX1_9BACT|nr:HAD hydrolase family protein [Horticoccus luteus]QYM77881.1 HAD hydrolase family protein [Horticoccus luteus]